MDLSIIIVCWKVKNLLKKCLESIYHETKNIKFEVFVIDNDSQDGTDEMVKKNFPRIKLIVNYKNVGFARANNQAIQEAKGDFVLLLNPDTEIIENALEKMVSFMKKNQEVGIAGCQLLNPDGTIQPSARKLPDLLSHIIILLKLHNFLPHLKSIKNYYMLNWPHNQVKEVDQIMGAFFLIRYEVIRKIGLLDNNFFIWYEEVDYCQRVKKAGWKVIYTPEAHIIHKKGKSFEQQFPIKKQLIFNKSILYYFKKHKPLWNYIILLILYPISILLACLVQLFNIKKQKKEL